MKRGIGIALVAVGLLMLGVSATSARQAPNLSFLIGTYLPGMLLIGLGAALRRERTLPADVSAESPFLASQVRRRSNAEMGLLGGVVLMFLGSGVSQQGREFFLFGTAVLIGGWALMIWGAATYMKWKGYSAWFGLLGLLLLPGLIALVCFPNRMKDMGHPFERGRSTTRTVVIVAGVTAVLLIMLPMTAFLAIPLVMDMLPQSASGGAWATVVSDPPMFSVVMPANATRQEVTQPVPDNRLTMTVRTIESRDDAGEYAVIYVPLPVDRLKTEDLLRTALDDWSNRLRGRVLNRTTISLGQYVGMEQTVEFDTGRKNRTGESIVCAMVCRGYVIRDSLVMFSVIFVDEDKIRAAMVARMARFFDSVKVDESAANNATRAEAIAPGAR